MKKIGKVEGRINILEKEGNITITIKDHKANTLIAEVVMTSRDFCTAAMGRLMSVKCEVEHGILDNVGKKALNEKFTFETPDLGYSDGGEKAKKIAIGKCPKGWEPDLYFGAQDSFSIRDGKHYATCVIRSFE